MGGSRQLSKFNCNLCLQVDGRIKISFTKMRESIARETLVSEDVKSRIDSEDSFPVDLDETAIERHVDEIMQ